MKVTLSNGDILQLDADSPIPMAFAVTSFDAIDQGRNQNIFNYEFIIPYQCNAQILGFAVDINSVGGARFRCEFIEATIEVKGMCLSGRIFLNSFTGTHVGTGRQIGISAQFVAGLSNFLQDCPTRLCDLELGEFTLTRDNVQSIIAQDQPYDGSNPIWFPAVNLGGQIAEFQFNENELAIPFSCLTPSIHDRAILDAIANSCDIRICSNFFDSDRFRNEMKTFGNECKYFANVLKITNVTTPTISGNFPGFGDISYSTQVDRDCIGLRPLPNTVAILVPEFNESARVQLSGSITLNNVQTGSQFCAVNIQTLEDLGCINVESGENLFNLSFDVDEGFFLFIRGSADLIDIDADLLREEISLKENSTLDIGKSLNCDATPRDIINDWTNQYNLKWFFSPLEKCLFVEPSWAYSTIAQQADCMITDSISTNAGSVGGVASTVDSFTGGITLVFQGTGTQSDLVQRMQDCIDRGDTMTFAFFDTISSTEPTGTSLIVGGTINSVQTGTELTITLTGATHVGCNALDNRGHEIFNQNISFYRFVSQELIPEIVEQSQGFYNGIQDISGEGKLLCTQEEGTFTPQNINRNLVFRYCELEGTTDTTTVVLKNRYPEGETAIELQLFAPVNSEPYTVFMQIINPETELATDFRYRLATQEQIDESRPIRATLNGGETIPQQIELGITAFPFSPINDDVPTLFAEPNEKLCTDKMIGLTKVESRSGLWYIRDFAGDDLPVTVYGHAVHSQTFDVLVRDFYTRDIEIYNDGQFLDVDFKLDISDFNFLNLFQRRKYIESCISGNGVYVLESLAVDDLNADICTGTARLFGDGK